MWVAEDMSSQELEELVAAAAAVGSHKLDGPADEAEVVAGPTAGKYSGADRVEGMVADNIQPSANKLVDGKRSEKENPTNLSKMFKFKNQVRDPTRDHATSTVPYGPHAQSSEILYNFACL